MFPQTAAAAQIAAVAAAYSSSSIHSSSHTPSPFASSSSTPLIQHATNNHLHYHSSEQSVNALYEDEAALHLLLLFLPLIHSPRPLALPSLMMRRIIIFIITPAQNQSMHYMQTKLVQQQRLHLLLPPLHFSLLPSCLLPHPFPSRMCR